MLVKSLLIKVFSALGATCIVGGAVAGGYILFTNSSNKFDQYYINPIVNSQNGFVSAYRSAKLKGARALLCPGFTHQEPIQATFNELSDEFKDTGFLLLDSVVDKKSRAAANTWNITFRSDLGSIKVGIAIAYFLNYYQKTFNDDGKLTWATWGGLDFSSVTSFMGGIQKGIEWANKNLNGKTINGNTYKNIEQIFSPAGEFTGGFGPGDGSALVTSIVSKRPDVLIPVAGPQVWSAQTEIEKLGNSKTILIGVDSAVENDPLNRKLNFTASNGAPIGNGKRVQFSSLKDLARATNIALDIINNGNKIPAIDSNDPDKYKNFSSTGSTGEQAGIGTSAVGDSINGCVGISDAGLNFFNEALKLAGTKTDPSIDPEYSNPDNMFYQGQKEKYYYGYVDKGGLAQHFSLNNDCVDSSGKPVENLNLDGFIKDGVGSDGEKIKVILSSVESILMDSSFSESCYIGLYYFYKSMNIYIPAPPGVQ